MLNSFYDKFIFTNGLKFRHGNFFLINLPFVMLPVDALASIAEKGDKSLDLAIYSSVKASIIGDVKNQFRIDFGIEGEKGLEFMEAYFSASGWGEIEKTDLDFGNARCLVSVLNSPVAQNCKGVKRPVDSFLRGFLAGIFSVYFRREVDCIESKCSATGDAHCEFVVKPASEFNFENPLTRDQLKTE
ncbi:V4R domain protein [uncultured archaeon]|nr:V4R domain protein [uncultured archaeon]